MTFWSLFSKFVSSCAASCAKSHKDGVVIVPHDLICMIHGLVLTSHLQVELSWTCRCTELLVFLTPKPQHLSLPSITDGHGICWFVSGSDGFRTNSLNLSARAKVWKSWFTLPGTKNFQFVLSEQLDPNLKREREREIPHGISVLYNMLSKAQTTSHSRVRRVFIKDKDTTRHVWRWRMCSLKSCWVISSYLTHYTHPRIHATPCVPPRSPSYSLDGGIRCVSPSS